MPRHALWLLGAAVLALHLWALQSLSLPVAHAPAVADRVLHTRVLPTARAPSPRDEPAAHAQRPTAKPSAPLRRRAASARAPAARTSTATAGPGSVTPAPPPQGSSGTRADIPLDDYERWLADMAARSPGTSAPARVADSPPAPEPALAPASEATPLAQEKVPATPAATHADSVATPAPAPAPMPPPLRLPPPTRLAFEVSGRVKGFDYHARGELVWKTDGTHYQLRQSISMLFLGSRAQQSQGLVTARGLRPERFTDEARKERTAQLDFETHRVRFSDGATAAADIGDDAQDRLSVFVQLGALIAAAPQDYPRGTRIRFETVGVRRVDHWTFEVQGPEVLHLPAGDTPALKLQRLPQDGDDQTDELWLGTGLSHLPVRIRLSQGGGDWVDLQLRGHETP